MDGNTIAIVTILAAVIVAYVAFGRDNLASSLRALFVGSKAKLARTIDDAVNRVEKAIADVETQLARANTGLVTIKQQRKSQERRLDDAKRNVAKYEAAAENAASVQKADLVTAAVTRKQAFENEVQQLQTTYDLLVGKENEVQQAVNTLTKRRANLMQQKVTIRTRASAAQTSIEVNQLLAGIDANGGQNDIARANDIVDELEAKAWATAEVAANSAAGSDIDAQLDALAAGSPNVEAEAAALMAKYSGAVQRLSTSTPSEERVEGNGTGNPRVESRG